MPFHIDRFKGSSAVVAMSHEAKMAYWYLLTKQWQSEDCSISADPLDLSQAAGLEDERWAVVAPRVLRQFKTTEDGRLRNQVCHDEWLDAKRVYEARRNSAKKTSEGRSPGGDRAVTEPNRHGDREVTDAKRGRSADTRTLTTVVPVGVESSSSREVPEDLEGLRPEMVARALAERIGVSLGYGPHSFNTAVTEVVAIEIRAGRSADDILAEMEVAYRHYQQEKPNIRTPWKPANFFGDGHWREPQAWPRKELNQREKAAQWRAPRDEAE